jgi:hypothetical protein
MFSLEAQLLLDQLQLHPDAYVRLVKVWTPEKGDHYVLQIAAYANKRWEGYWMQEIEPIPETDAEGNTVALTVVELQELVEYGAVTQTTPPDSPEVTYRLTEAV